MAYDHETAAPLMAAVTAAWDAHLKISEQQGTMLAKSACANNFDFVGIDAAVGNVTTAVEALAAYIATLAPE